MEIETTHLRLLPYAPAYQLALIESVERFEAISGLRAADGLREFIVSDEVSPVYLARLRSATATDPWHHGFALLDRESDTVVGSAGFKGPPDGDGMVEIGYGIVPGFQGRGYATEVAAALVTFAGESGQARLVRAHTLSSNRAPKRVLEKCGFRNVGEVMDPEDGRVNRWERPCGDGPPPSSGIS
jgi:RimJ/RimL family protein N-acetyltransferase